MSSSSPMMTAMDNFITTANQGLVLLCQDRLAEAALCFKAALKDLCQRNHNSTTDTDTNTDFLGAAALSNVRFESYNTQNAMTRSMPSLFSSTTTTAGHQGSSSSNSSSSNSNNSSNNNNSCLTVQGQDHQVMTTNDIHDDGPDSHYDDYTETDLETTTETFFTDHNTLYFHQSAFWFGKNRHGGEPRDAVQHAHTLASALLFNWALTHHLRAMSGRTRRTSMTNNNNTTTTNNMSRDQHLQAALQLYDMALEAAYRGFDDDQDDDDDDWIMTCHMPAAARRTLLAIHNNLCHAHYSTFDLDGLSDNLQALDAVLSYCTGAELEAHYDIRMNVVYHHHATATATNRATTDSNSTNPSHQLLRTAPAA